MNRDTRQPKIQEADPRLLGRRLQDARNAKGLTRRRVADSLGIAMTTVAAIEEGARNAQPVELIRMASLYGKPVSYFVGNTPDWALERTKDGKRLSRRRQLLAVRAYKRAELTEGELSRLFGVDRVTARGIVQRLAHDPRLIEEGEMATLSNDLSSSPDD